MSAVLLLCPLYKCLLLRLRWKAPGMSCICQWIRRRNPTSYTSDPWVNAYLYISLSSAISLLYDKTTYRPLRAWPWPSYCIDATSTAQAEPSHTAYTTCSACEYPHRYRLGGERLPRSFCTLWYGAAQPRQWARWLGLYRWLLLPRQHHRRLQPYPPERHRRRRPLRYILLPDYLACFG